MLQLKTITTLSVYDDGRNNKNNNGRYHDS